MPYRSPSIVCSLALAAVLNFSGLYSQELPPHSYAGKMPALGSLGVAELALRNDGRYLVYSTGSSKWGVIDLLVMQSMPVVEDSEDGQKVSGNIVGLFFRSANELVVASTSVVQLVDVEEILKPEKDDVFELPSDSLTPMDACMDESGKVFILERDTDGDEQEEHQIRVVAADFTAFTERPQWDEIFPNSAPDSNEILPLGLLCSKDSVIVMGAYFEEGESVERLILSSLSRNSPFGRQGGLDLIAQNEQFHFQDLILDAKRERVLALLNKNEDEIDGDEDDSQVFRFNTSSFSAASSMSVGQGGQLLASYARGDSQYYNFFVGTDHLDPSAGDPPLNKVLQINSSNFGSAAAVWEDRGDFVDGLAPPSDRPSQWWSVASDNYVYGLISGGGVALFTDAPQLDLLEEPSDLEIGQSVPLEFRIKFDRDVNYEFRLVDDLEKEGEGSGINLSRGRQVLTGSLNAGQEKDFSLSVSELGLRSDRVQYLLILAEQKFADTNFPTSRFSIPFLYDPPPSAVENLHLGFGSRSLHVFFDAPYNPGDISKYLIYVAETKAELSELPLNQDELDEDWSGREIRGHGSTRISVPISVPLAEWDGSYVIDPLRDNESLWVRVQVVDDKGNFSTGNPAAVKGTPRPTKSLVSAFGSASCNLHLQSSRKLRDLLSILLFLSLLILLRAKFSRI